MNKFAIGSAVFLGVCSAYFSILGLAQIFHGAFWQVLVMGVALEIGKFAAALFVHKHWTQLGSILKVYLAIATIFLMTLTSAGIFGFLAKSSQSVTAPIAAEQTRLAYIDVQLKNLDDQRARTQKQLDALDGMVGIYTKQTEFDDARKGVRLFSRQQSQRSAAESSIKKIDAEQQTLLQEKLTIDQKVQAIEVEVGPAVYVAQAIYGGKDIGSVESAIRVVIFLIIFAFDPLAIALLIGAQKVQVRKEAPAVVPVERFEQINTETNTNPEIAQVAPYEETHNHAYKDIVNKMREGIIEKPVSEYSDIVARMAEERKNRSRRG